MARRWKYDSMAQIAGPYDAGNLPDCLCSSGKLINSPIDPPPKPDLTSVVRAIFAEGAEFGDVSRALIDKVEPFAVVVRAANVPRLVEVAKELKREMRVVRISKKDDPGRLYGRLYVQGLPDEEMANDMRAAGFTVVDE